MVEGTQHNAKFDKSDFAKPTEVVLAVDAIHVPLTGIGRYTFELARNLISLPGVQVHMVNGPAAVTELPCLEPDSYGKELARSFAAKLPGMLILRRLAANVLERRLLKRYQRAIYHGPNYRIPPFDGPCVATIHDLSVYALPDHHPPDRVKQVRHDIQRTLNRADFLLTDSEFIRQEVIRRFAWPEAKIRSIPLAAGDEFCPRSTEETTPSLNRHGLTHGEYCLFSGTIEPRKNIEALLTAYEALPAGVRDRFPLVLCGHAGWGSESIHARIEEAQRKGWVRYLGYVPDEELPLIYSGARLFVFPSLYEGFGLPVLEAMASGVPVVASDLPTTLEIGGDLIDTSAPEDVDGLRENILRVLEESASAIHQSQALVQRASEFSWSKCAETTLAAYRLLTV